MNIEQFAKRKVELQLTLAAINQWNTYGKTLDELKKKK